MALKPLRDCFLFAFTNDTSGGMFIEKNKGGIILTNQDMLSQSKYARWGKVLAVGPDVTSFKNGDLVLIEYAQWTPGFTFDEVKVWKSDERKVCAIGEDESVIFAY